MELYARLVHAEAGCRVVEVRASRGETSLGSAVAEAATAQEAEDLAMARLLDRLAMATTAAAARPMDSSQQSLASSGDSPPRPAAALSSGPAAVVGAFSPTAEAELPTAEPTVATTLPGPPPTLTAPLGQAPRISTAARTSGQQPLAAPAPQDATPASPSDPGEEPPADPEDWSQELTAVDLQLRRLGWTREQEGTYLQRVFGHPSRSRLTRYGDLRAYLMALEGLEPGRDPAAAAVPLRRSELLAQGDALLAQLGWSAEEGRALLERELQRISRQQLSDVQLLQFNMLLESELLAVGAPVGAADPDGAQR